MKQVYFRKIIIADVAKETAYVQEFTTGLNVVTSTDNHVGKSSLLKSLYYAMGAEVNFDDKWDKNSKLYVVTFSVDDEEYQIARWMRRFAVFQGKKLLKLTDSVTQELAPLLGNIFGFTVHLPNKRTKKVELAPPAFLYMPYYIDQDKGWTELYNSFASIDQYSKDERIKSLYYHLNVYTKNTVELMTRRDNLKDDKKAFEEESQRLTTVLTALNEEVKNLPPAENMAELDVDLKLPKKRIEEMVAEIGQIRNQIQALEATLHRHQHQLHVIQEHTRSKKDPAEKQESPIFVCPQCGYIPNEEIFNIVKENYGALNEDYMCQQIQLLITDISQNLLAVKTAYIEKMALLKQEETAFEAQQDEFDVYIRQRGLRASVRRFQDQLGSIHIDIANAEAEINKINQELRKLPNKKEVEEKYIEFARANIMQLGAWDATYDNNISLLKPVKAQGTLENKIILAQFVALFQTMVSFNSSATRFPFVIDSPRGNEASAASSKDIIKMIANMDMLPQIILATIDYAEFSEDLPAPAMTVTLTEQRKLLSDTPYNENAETIRALLELLKRVS